MSLARPWWLAGLALLLPLVLIHLRRPTFVTREVGSVLVWDRFMRPADAPRHRFRRPRHPLLLALQCLVLAALVVAVAGPRLDAAVVHPRTVFVVDESLWMRVHGRSAAAARAVQRVAAEDGNARVALVVTGEPPTVAYVGSRTGLASTLAHRHAGRRADDLAVAVGVASGLADGRGGRIVVVRAPEDPLPRVSAPAGSVADVVVGTPADDQGLFDASADCGIGPEGVCEVLALVRNGSNHGRIDGYSARTGSGASLRGQVAVPARSSRPLVLTAPPASTVTLQLTGGDALPTDDRAVVAVPGAADVPAAAVVTLVGDPTDARPLARALASVPGVTLKLRTPASYRAADATSSALVVVDGALTPGVLPPSPAVLLIHPSRLPWGAVTGTIALPSVTGEADGSELLDGLDLTSLSIDRGAAETIASPSWLAPVVWTAGGPLLAAGDDGRRRVALLTFDLSRSNLAQLPALPILLRNVVRWAEGWADVDDAGALRVDAVPGATQADVAGARLALHDAAAGVTDLAPGPIAVEASGGGASQVRTLVSGSSSPSADGVPIDLGAALTEPVRGDARSLVPWLLALAIVAMLGEWALWRRVRR